MIITTTAAAATTRPGIKVEYMKVFYHCLYIQAGCMLAGFYFVFMFFKLFAKT